MLSLQSIGVDTNILFSGLYYQGKPYKIVQEVVRNQVNVCISEYIRSEIIRVIARVNVPEITVREFFEMPNVRVISDLNYEIEKLYQEAEEIVRDQKDWPVYAFAKFALENKLIEKFITGDFDLLTPEVRNALDNRICSAMEFLETKKA